MRVMFDVTDCEGVSAIRARLNEETNQVYLVGIPVYNNGEAVDILVLSTGMEITILGRDPFGGIVPITFEVLLDTEKVDFRSTDKRFNWAGTMKMGKTYEMVDVTDVHWFRSPYLDKYEANWDDDAVVTDPFHTHS